MTIGCAGNDDQAGANRPVPVIPDHTLLRRIGRGSYGEVWLAQNVMGTYRAIKVVHRASFDDERPYEREYAGIRKFEPISRSHESQVQILHIGRNDPEGYFYYVMELADDASQVRNADCGLRNEEGGGRRAEPPSADCGLRNAESSIQPGSYVPRTLQHDVETRGRLPFGECLSISLGLAGALKHLHARGLVHRDIKPSNIIFVNGIPKLADIGLVTESEATLSYVGAQGFMAPEGPGRPRGDLYSLGKVIYEMCTGRDRLSFPSLPPGFGDWPDREQVNELLTVSLKACEPDPNRRHASAEALLADLVMIQAGKSVRRLRTLERGRRWALAALVFGTLVFVLALLGGWVLGRVRHREVLLRDAGILRVADPLEGWSRKALGKLQVAGGISLDDDVRAQAAATFAGWDVQEVGRLTNHGADFMVFDQRGRRLLMDGGATAKHARLWDTVTGEVKEYTTSGRGPVWFGRDGRPRLLNTANAGVYPIVSLADGRELSRFEFQPGSLGRGTNLGLPAAVSPDGSLAAVVVKRVAKTAEGLEQQACHLAVWQTETGATVWKGAEPCTAVAFSPDGKCLAIGSPEGNVQVRSLPEWRLVAAFTNDHAAVNSLAFGRDPRQPAETDGTAPWLLAAGSAGGTVWIHHLSPLASQAICRGAYYNVMSLAFAPDGMTLISGGRGWPLVWDVVTGRPLLRIERGDFAAALTLTPDGRKLAVGTQAGFNRTPGEVRLVSLQPDCGVKGLRGLSSQSGRVAFSRDGQRLAAVAQNWEVGIWNLVSNRLEHVLQAPQGESSDNAALAFSRDGALFAFATSEGAKLWDVPSGAELRSFRLPKGLQEQLWFDGVGRLFLFQWDRPSPGQPGDCVVRELSRTNYLEPLWRSRFFDGRIFHSCLAWDGHALALSGSLLTNGFTSHVLEVIDPQSGQRLCSLPALNKGDGDSFCLDAGGELLGCFDSAEIESGMNVFEIPSGRPAFHLTERVDLISRGGEWLGCRLWGRGVNSGVRIWRRDNSRRSVVLGTGLWGPGFPEFSRDGQWIAWGTADGTVFVAGMADVFRRLEELGLGWR
jgi:hypothetical protein